jgi:hypothetical protein
MRINLLVRSSQLMEMSDKQSKRIDLAAESIKQQVTLATVLVTTMVTLAKQVSEARQGNIWRALPYSFFPLAIFNCFGSLRTHDDFLLSWTGEESVERLLGEIVRHLTKRIILSVAFCARMDRNIRLNAGSYTSVFIRCDR